MRVGPLSQKHTIDYIHAHFVPYFLSNEAYNAGKFGKNERDLLTTLRRNAKSKGMRAGSVQVYLLTGDAEVVDVLTVSEASNAAKLVSFLRKNVAAHNVSAGPRLIKEKSTRPVPSTTKSELVMRVVAQYKPQQKITVEDWIKLDSNEWQNFLPPATGERAWMIEDAVTRKLFVKLYPYAMNWDHDLDQIELARLEANVIKQSDHETVIGLRGKLQMEHYVYVRSGKQKVIAELTGFVIARPNKQPEVTIITETAKFGNRNFEGLLQTRLPPKQTTLD